MWHSIPTSDGKPVCVNSVLTRFRTFEILRHSSSSTGRISAPQQVGHGHKIRSVKSISLSCLSDSLLTQWKRIFIIPAFLATPTTIARSQLRQSCCPCESGLSHTSNLDLDKLDCRNLATKQGLSVLVPVAAPLSCSMYPCSAA